MNLTHTHKTKAPFNYRAAIKAASFYMIAGAVAAYIAVNNPGMPRPFLAFLFVALAGLATLAAWWWGTPPAPASTIGQCDKCGSRNVMYCIEVSDNDRKPTLICCDCGQVMSLV